MREIRELINEHMLGGASKDTKAVVARIDSARDAREDFKR
jgi:hypothetical protein